jgi:RND family efflux transporter MFP subunit
VLSRPVTRKMTRLRSASAPLLLLSVVALLSACQRAAEEPKPEIRPVRAITVQPSNNAGIVALTGTVQAQTEINESFRIDGRLIERTVDIGDTVRPGQLIARLDPENEESSLQAARAGLNAARARLGEAQTNFTRMRDLIVDSAVSRAQYEQAEAALKTAEAGVETAQEQVNLSQNRLSYTRLVATAAGVVTARGPEPGEVVSAGRMVIQVAREGGRDAVFDVPAQLKNSAPLRASVATANAKSGAAAGAGAAEISIALAMDPSVSAIGRVREVSPRADPITGTFAVRVRLIDPPPEMLLGSTVTGRLQRTGTPAIVVPATALVRTEGRTSVWVFDKTAGTVALRTIELGNADANNVQVASGLKPGEIVVTAGAQALRPGQKVRLLEDRS